MRTEDKVMNNRKLQAKQEKLKSLHCPSPQSSLFNSRDSSFSSRLSSLISHSPVPIPDQSAKSPSISSKHNSKCATPSPQNSDESAICYSQYKSECLTRCLQHNDELATGSPQHLFIDVSTELLRQGQSVRFRAPGLSMHPAIKEGEVITVVPVSSFDIKRGDILLYIVGRKVIAHRVVRIKREKSNFATQSTSDSSVNSSIHASTPSLTHSSTHSSTQASTNFKTLNPQLIFILRGDASAACDNPVEAQQILGKVVSVEKNGRSIDLYSRRARILRVAYAWGSRFKRLILSILNKLGEICNEYEYDTLQ